MLHRPGPAPARGRRVAEQLAHGGHHGADGVPLGDLAQAVGQPASGNEHIRQEGEREHDHERHAHNRVWGANRHAHEDPEPHHRDREQAEQPEPRQRMRHVLVDAPADDQTTDGHHHEGDRRRGELGDQVADDERGARHRQRAEAVNDSFGQVRRNRDPRAHHPEGERLHEDPANQVLVVRAAGDVDHTAEHVGEQQHEHQRLQRHVEQLLGDLPDVLQVAARERERVGQGPAQG
jgi:hypothetical protein